MTQRVVVLNHNHDRRREKMNKLSVAAVAISVTSVLQALPPAGKFESKIYCLSAYQRSNGKVLGGCDETDNNKIKKLVVNEDCCTANQFALYTKKWEGQGDWYIKIWPCMPPNVVQL
jgi:hypothetical protein